MLARGVVVTYEAIRHWCLTFGQTFANALRRRRLQLGDMWHIDAVFLKINGQTSYLWRVVDQDGSVLAIRVQRRRHVRAAKKFFRTLLEGARDVPRVLITDRLVSYGVAQRALLPDVKHRRSRYLNNRTENSHQPTRQRERALKHFTSAVHAQRFLAAFSRISPHYRPCRHRLPVQEYRQEDSRPLPDLERGDRRGRCRLIRARSLTSGAPQMRDAYGQPLIQGQ